MAAQTQFSRYERQDTRYETIRRPYSIIGEFGTHISVGNKFGIRGVTAEYSEKIPEANLQEDQKLLMWYDQAITRTGGQ